MSLPLPWDDPRIASGMKEQLAARRAQLAAGEEALGWKVGFGAPAAMEKFKISGPCVGYLLKRGMVPSGGSVSLGNWVKPVAEPEIAIRLGTDVPPIADRAAAAAAIASLAPAIELADIDIPPDDLEAVLKRNIFQRHVVLGPLDASRTGANTAGLVGRVFRRGAEFAHTDTPEALTGLLPDIVRHVAALLGAFGEKLAADEIIIAGSIVPPLFIEFDETEVGYRLDPIGSVTVKFER